MKNILKQGISLLIQWGIQKLILMATSKGATASEHATQLSGSLAAVYANAYASAAAIPMVGWMIAPGVAAKALLAASAGAGAAMGVGAGMGMASAALAEGGVITKPMQGVVGEAGPEAYLPLQNPAAKRMLREMFPQTGGGEGVTVYTTQHFHGDNWAESGIRPELIDQITEAQADAIRLGRSLAMPTKVR